MKGLFIIKRKRIVNKQLCDEIRKRPCCNCGSSGIIDIHHLKTRGSWGDDLEFNLVPLDRKCHVDLHKKGTNRFVELNPAFQVYIMDKGWYWDEYRKRWLHNDLMA